MTIGFDGLVGIEISFGNSRTEREARGDDAGGGVGASRKGVDIDGDRLTYVA